MPDFSKKFRRTAAVVMFCAAALNAVYAAAASAAPTSAELEEERQHVEEWKAQRLASLTSETGWLTLSGLFWLKPGENTFGSSKSSTFHLDNAALAPQAGTFVLDGGVVRFIASEGARIMHAGKLVTDIELASDLTSEPTILQSGSLSFFLIDRAGELGIRVRDSENPYRTNFHGLDYFPVADNWVVNASFEPYEPQRKISIVNILGLREDIVSPGALVFTHQGKEYRLDALLETPSDEELFIMFADDTSGEETYGAGRFMYVPLPRDGIVRLNFNEAYNPPCAFNIFATCPLPPPQNRLALRVEAGEKTYSGHEEF